MEKMDRDLEKRVWQRVNGKSGPDMPVYRQDNLKKWILEVQENAAAYRALALQLIGKPWEGLRRLETESMRMVHCLRGFSALRGEPVKLTPVPQPRDQPRRALEKCFHRTHGLWEELDRRSADPETGMLYRRLRTLAEEHCITLAEMLGKMD